MIAQELHRDFPWARLHALDYPVRLDALGRVLEEIRAARTRTDHADPRTDADGLVGDSTDTQLPVLHSLTVHSLPSSHGKPLGAAFPA